MSLGERVAKNAKALRVERGFSQKEVANKTGLTVRYISRLENSAQNLTLEVIEKLSRALGCTPVELLGANETPMDSGSKEVLDQTIRFLQSLRSRL